LLLSKKVSIFAIVENPLIDVGLGLDLNWIVNQIFVMDLDWIDNPKKLDCATA
jgi:hypothetical protein